MGDEINQRPIILQTGAFTGGDVKNLKTQNALFEVADIYEHQLGELFRVLHPSQHPTGPEFESFKHEKGIGELAGVWVYYPWSGVLLHGLGQEDLFTLRTNRNQLLITKEEQQQLSQTVVGITGMSVGAGIALAMAYSGISETIKIADFDKLDTSNLNRLRETLSSVGKPKVTLAARHIYELDPFADVQIFEEGVNETNIDSFFGDPKLGVAIDEIDDFRTKIKLRLHAKKHKVPLLMFTSLGDNILIDVERYDSNEGQEPFNGLLPELSQEILDNKEISDDDARRYAVELVGAEYVPTRALHSLTKMGTELVGRPQLYSTIAVDGGLAAYVVKRIVLHGDVASGRYFVKFGDLLKVVEQDLGQDERRRKVLQLLFS